MDLPSRKCASELPTLLLICTTLLYVLVDAHAAATCDICKESTAQQPIPFDTPAALELFLEDRSLKGSLQMIGSMCKALNDDLACLTDCGSPEQADVTMYPNLQYWCGQLGQTELRVGALPCIIHNRLMFRQSCSDFMRRYRREQLMAYQAIRTRNPNQLLVWAAVESSKRRMKECINDIADTLCPGPGSRSIRNFFELLP